MQMQVDWREDEEEREDTSISTSTLLRSYSTSPRQKKVGPKTPSLVLIPSDLAHQLQRMQNTRKWGQETNINITHHMPTPPPSRKSQSQRTYSSTAIILILGLRHKTTFTLIPHFSAPTHVLKAMQRQQ